MSSLGTTVIDLVREHGEAAVVDALQHLPDLIRAIKAGRRQRVIDAINAAHTKVDEMADAEHRRRNGEDQQ